MTALIAWLKQYVGANRAVGYLLLARIWQFGAGLVTVTFLLRSYSEEFRDHYYLFSNLLGLQMFAELGLPMILIILASHEWSALQLAPTGEITGEPSALQRLASLDRFGARWFRVCAFLMFAGVGCAGWEFSRGKSDYSLVWQLPWWTTVAVNAWTLTYLPRLSLLEGCNQLVMINFVRICQAVTGSLAVWACLGSGAGIWSLAVANLVRGAWECYLVEVYYRRFFRTLRQSPESAERISWKREIWPLQWRLALQSVAGYFSTYFFVPVLYKYGREGEAGQMGMTWNILSTIQQTSLSWVQTRTPEFGMLAARRDLDTLERRLFRTGCISVGVFLLGAASFWLLLAGLHWQGIRVVNGFLPLSTTAVLILGLTAVQVALVQHVYVRIHKRDPFVVIGTFSSLAVAGLVWYFGSRYGAWGLAWAYTGFCFSYTLPVSVTILLIYRKQFRAEAVAAEQPSRSAS